MKEIVLLVVFFVILFSYLFYMNKRKKNDVITEETDEEKSKRLRAEKIASGECCGQHAVCEKETLMNTKLKADYYDDEELDVFANREPSSYTDEEITQFQNVLYTMKDFDVAGWLKSLQLREIQLPDVVKDEALLIVSERRASKKNNF